MKSVFLSLTIISLSSLACQADCRRVGNSVYCDDGTTYNTVGNTTYGSNRNTGSNWSQTEIGSNTYGTDSEGKSWSAIRSGNTTYYTDSDGNSKTCTVLNGQTNCY